MHLQEWGKAILQAAVIIVILFFFCWPMRISGSSMESTMKDGEIVLMSRFATMQEKYETGDIVMFHYYDADGGKTVVKRIIATEEYVHGRTDGLVDMTVPKGTVFVMGDNRGESFDSRNMGAIPCEDLKGKVFFRLFPLGRIR